MSGSTKSPFITAEMAAKIKGLLQKGELLQHQIAALFNVNQGRISEINTGKRFPNVKPQLD